MQLKDLLPHMQFKEKNYRNQHPIDQFLLLTIEVFGCLCKHVNVFLHDCANPIRSLKGIEGIIFTLVTFFVKKFQSHYKGCKHLPS
jgi:hypothetical protein